MKIPEHFDWTLGKAQDNPDPSENTRWRMHPQPVPLTEERLRAEWKFRPEVENLLNGVTLVALLNTLFNASRIREQCRWGHPLHLLLEIATPRQNMVDVQAVARRYRKGVVNEVSDRLLKEAACLAERDRPYPYYTSVD